MMRIPNWLLTTLVILGSSVCFANVEIRTIFQSPQEVIVELEMQTLEIDTKNSNTESISIIKLRETSPLGRSEILAKPSVSKMLYLPDGFQLQYKILKLDERRLTVAGKPVIQVHDPDGCGYKNLPLASEKKDGKSPIKISKPQLIIGHLTSIVTFFPIDFDASNGQLTVRKHVVVQFRFLKTNASKKSFLNVSSKRLNSLLTARYLNQQMFSMAPEDLSKSKDGENQSNTLPIIGVDNRLLQSCASEREDDRYDWTSLANDAGVDLRLIDPLKKPPILDCPDCGMKIFSGEIQPQGMNVVNSREPLNGTNHLEFHWIRSNPTPAGEASLELKSLKSNQTVFKIIEASAGHIKTDFVEALILGLQKDSTLTEVVDYVAVNRFLDNFEPFLEKKFEHVAGESGPPLSLRRLN